MSGNNQRWTIQNFFVELERRRVHRVAAGYLAVGWMLLEATNLIFERLGFSDAVFDSVLMLTALGFPVALVLSWTFDITRDGIVKTEAARGSGKFTPAQITEIAIIAVLLIALSYLIVERQYAPASHKVIQPTEFAPNSIGVLPFVSMSGDVDNEYFSDGVTEELLNALANVKHLQVAARTSSFYFKGKNFNITEIGKILGVGMVLEGSVRKAANRVKITAQLIDVSNGFHVWSNTYEGELKNIFALQTEITRQVVNAVTPMLLPELANQPNPIEVDTKSYEHYLRGRQYLRGMRDFSDVKDARAQFEKSLKSDPTFALAYAGLCDVGLLEYTRYREPAVFEGAEATCNRALARQPGNARSQEIHSALAELYRNAGEYEKSMDEIRVASSVNGDTPQLLLSKGMTLAAMGMTEQAEVAMLDALKLNSKSWANRTELGNFYYDQKRFAESVEQYQLVLAMVPSFASALIGMASAQYMAGDEQAAQETWVLAEKEATAQDAGSLGNVYTNLGLTYYYQGDYQRAAELQLKSINLRPADHRPWGRLAESYRGLQNREQEQEAYAQAIELALEELKINPTDSESLGLLGIYYAFTQKKTAAHDYRERMLAQNSENSTSLYFASLISLALEDTDSAFSYLEEAHSNGLDGRFIAGDPDLQQLRHVDAQRFEAISGNRN